MYATIVHQFKKPLFNFSKRPAWDVQVKTFAALPDAVALIDEELNRKAEPQAQAYEIPATNKEQGIPSVMMDAHSNGKDVWLMWVPQTAPSKVIFQNDKGVVRLKDCFSMRNIRHGSERGTITANDAICEIFF